MKKNVILVVALFALMVVGVFAQQADPESDFQVTKEGNAITITKYVGTKTTVNIPSRIQNLPVAKIGNDAFKASKITSVTIPDSVIRIEANAFNGTSLTSVTIPKSVKWIGSSAFANCNSLTSVTFQSEIMRTEFADDAFGVMAGLKDAFYASSVVGTLGTYTRPSAGMLEGSKWARTQATTAPASSGDPESDFQVTKEGNAITITKYVGTKTTVNIPSRIQNLPVTKIGVEAFNNCKNITSVTIPNSVTVIDFGAFGFCTSLTSITIPNSVTEIGERVFEGTKLTNVIIPNSVKTIGIAAFINSSITSVTIGNGVTTIDGSAFSGCTNLTSITIPASVISIGSSVISGCINIVSVTFQGTIPVAGFNQRAFPGDLRDKFYATDKAKGTAGTYTRPNGTSTTWTKK